MGHITSSFVVYWIFLVLCASAAFQDTVHLPVDQALSLCANQLGPMCGCTASTPSNCDFNGYTPYNEQFTMSTGEVRGIGYGWTLSDTDVGTTLPAGQTTLTFGAYTGNVAPSGDVNFVLVERNDFSLANFGLTGLNSPVQVLKNGTASPSFPLLSNWGANKGTCGYFHLAASTQDRIYYLAIAMANLQLLQTDEARGVRWYGGLQVPDSSRSCAIDPAVPTTAPATTTPVPTTTLPPATTTSTPTTTAPCVPLSQSQACGHQCGVSVSNGCGGTVQCLECCVPMTQQQACGSQCGTTASNGCGGSIECPTCCSPLTQQQACGSRCGILVSNGCSSFIQCPACCTPLSQKQACGSQCSTSVDNGCGGTLQCPACCTPLTQQEACGTQCDIVVSNNCGGIVQCPACATPAPTTETPAPSPPAPTINPGTITTVGREGFVVTFTAECPTSNQLNLYLESLAALIDVDKRSVASVSPLNCSFSTSTLGVVIKTQSGQIDAALVAPAVSLINNGDLLPPNAAEELPPPFAAATRVQIPVGFVRLTALCKSGTTYSVRVRHESGPNGILFAIQRGNRIVIGPHIINYNEEKIFDIPLSVNALRLVAVDGWLNDFTGTISSPSNACSAK